MNQKLLALGVSLFVVTHLLAQTKDEAPQSARQALIEMFLAKGGENFAKHLSDDTRKTLIRRGETSESSMVLRFASIAGQGMLSEHVETFDSGPNILVSDDPSGHQRTEVAIEHDSQSGDNDEIELSVHIYVDGREQSMQVVPRLTFTLQQENDVWRLTEMTIAAHVPLADPDYLNGLRKRQDEANESAAQGRIAMIERAESAYAANHPDAGYTCSLAQLFAPPAGNTQDSSFYDSYYLSEESNGYHFSLTGCGGSPASKYAISAVPMDSASSMQSFCSDQSGTMRWVAEGNTSSCVSDGQPVNENSEADPSE